MSKLTSNSIKSARSSFPFLSILALIFITLKLTGYISWSWWWVTAPLWAPSAIILVIAVLLLGACLIFGQKKS